MIVFKKLKSKRIFPFKVLDDESEAPPKDDESLEEIEGSDWKQIPENKKRTSDGKMLNLGVDDAASIRKDQCIKAHLFCFYYLICLPRISSFEFHSIRIWDDVG